MRYAADKISREQDKARRSINRMTREAVFTQQYTVTINAFAVTLPADKIQAVEQIPGVKAVYADRYYRAVNLSAEQMSGAQINLPDSNYDGTGIIIAVLDTGFDVEHPMFSAAVSADGQLTEQEIQNIFASVPNGMRAGAYDRATFKSEKIPFAYDYAERKTDVFSKDAHGTHVAGIAAGGVVHVAFPDIPLRGTAPGAQLLAMKVFTCGNEIAQEAVLIAAFEDAVVLGANVVNMSVGSDYAMPGSSRSYSALNRVMTRAAAAGVTVVAAAGNSSYMKSDFGGGRDTLYPDYGTVNKPAALQGYIGVASCDSAVYYERYFLAGGTRIVYRDTCPAMFNAPFAELREGQFDIVPVPGLGRPSDFGGLDLRGKIALIRRGHLYFTEKINNAYDAGATAVIIYNDLEIRDEYDDGLVRMDLTGARLPAVFITKEDGEKLIEQRARNVVFHASYVKVLPSKTENQMSPFSSWGPAGDLKLKPDITFPGNGIMSSVPSGGYAEKSGTSMAAPHAAGAAAILKQYIFENYPELSRIRAAELTAQKLMSTAVPLIDPSTMILYSPRRQGAGLADIAAAISTDTVLYCKQSRQTKIELGDRQRFILSLDFVIDNKGGTDRTYNILPTVLHDKPRDVGFNIRADGTAEMEPHSFLVNGEAVSEITAEAGKITEINVTINLFRIQLDRLLVSFPNGTYTEGFISLIPEDGSPVLSIPFLGFWGDWGAAPVIEPYDIYTQDRIGGVFPYFAGNRLSGTRNEEEYERSLTAGRPVPLETLGAFGSSVPGEAIGYDSRFIAISPNGDKVLDYCAPTLNLLRAVSSGYYTVYDASGRRVWRSPDIGERYKFFDEQLADDSRLRWYGTDQNGRRLPDGPYTIEMTVVGAISRREETWTIPVTIDTVSPTISAVTYDEATGILSVNARDNHYVKTVEMRVRGSDGKIFTYGTQEFYRGDVSSVTAEFCLPGVLLREPQANAVIITVIDFAGNEAMLTKDITGYSIPVLDMRGKPAAVGREILSMRQGIEEHGMLYIVRGSDNGKADIHLERETLRLLANWNAGLRILADENTAAFTAGQLKEMARHDFAGGVTLTLTVGYDSERQIAAGIGVKSGEVEITGMALLSIEYPAYTDESEMFAAYNGNPVINSFHDNGKQMTVRAEFNRSYTIHSNESPYDDVWRIHRPKAINFLTARNVMEGGGDRKFWPDNHVTRAEFTKIMAVTAGIDSALYQNQNPFSDVRAASWYAPYVAWAAEAGLTMGTGNNTFNPHGRITFEEMAVFTARFAAYRGTDLPDAGTQARFADHNGIRSWARDAASSLLQAGIIYGDVRGNLNPQRSVLRFETADIVFRYIVYGIFCGY
jgi:subtilisin family serine protease